MNRAAAPSEDLDERARRRQELFMRLLQGAVA